jgi:hypothetical protein
MTEQREIYFEPYAANLLPALNAAAQNTSNELTEKEVRRSATTSLRRQGPTLAVHGRRAAAGRAIPG